MNENEQELRKENKMGVMPVNRLLISVSAPIMLSMLVQALYNVVDSLFVSRISENAFNAVSLAFPIQSLMIAVAVGTGVGVNAFLSRSLGQKNYEKVNLTATNGIFLCLCGYVVFAVLGAIFSRTFFEVQTDVAEIVEGGADYMWICTVFSVGLFAQIIMERLLQATGRSVWSMATQMLGALLNIILDPIFIFVMDMGVAGAAVATVVGQLAGMLFGIYLNLKKNPDIKISFRGFRPNGAIIRSIYAVGIPSIIMQSINAVVIFALNQILIAFTTTATAVLGAYFKLQSFVFMPVFGLNNGLVPIVAYNFGAKKPDRMVKAVKLGVTYSVSIMALGFLLFLLAPEALLRIFDASPYMLEIGVPAMRILSMSFIPAGFGIIASGMFQALGHGVMSLVESMVRQVVLLLPMAWLLAQLGRVELVWLAFPLASFAAVLVSAVLIFRIHRREVRPLFREVERQQAANDMEN